MLVPRSFLCALSGASYRCPKVFCPPTSAIRVFSALLERSQMRRRRKYATSTKTIAREILTDKSRLQSRAVLQKEYLAMRRNEICLRLDYAEVVCRWILNNFEGLQNDRMDGNFSPEEDG